MLQKLTPLHRKGIYHLAIALAGYTLVFYILSERIGGVVAALAVFPVLVGAWYFGISGGISTVFITALIDALILYQFDYSVTPAYLRASLMGITGLFGMAFVSGYSSQLLKEYRQLIDERVRIAEKAEAQSQLFICLSEMTNTVLKSRDLHSILQSLTEQTREMFSADDSLISLWDEEQGLPVPTVADGARKEELVTARPHLGDKTLAGSALDSGKVLVIPNPSQSDFVENWIAERWMPGPALAMPLRSGDQKLGAMLLFYNQPRLFSESELASAELTSKQLSLALAKSYLLDTARQQLLDLKVLNAVSLAIAETQEQAPLLDKVVQIVGDSLSPDNLVILLVDEMKQNVHLASNYHKEEDTFFDTVPLGQGITGAAMQTGKAKRVGDVSTEPDYLCIFTNTRSELCVPIKLGTQVIGVINAESNEFDHFSAQDENLMLTIANQLATGLDRIRIAEGQNEWNQQIQRSNQQIYILTQVATRMETTSNPDDVMRIMGEQLQSLGLETLISLFVPGSQDLIIRYTSIAPSILQEFEQLANHTMMNSLRIPLTQLPPRLNVFEYPEASLEEDVVELITVMLKDFPKETIQRILKPAGMTSDMMVGHFPLIFQDKILGFLWLWGTDFRAADMPTLSLFANQVASALESARLFKDVQHLAITDGLTGLFTRRHFFEMAYEEFYRARRYGHPLSILMVDFDHFKQINDKYGHRMGDFVLQTASTLFMKVLRSTDIVGRYGGEEFVILLTETDLAAAQRIAHRLRVVIENMLVPSKKGSVKVTISGGVAGDNIEETNLIDMIELADQALYAAKRAGRNNIQVAPAQSGDAGN